MPYKGRDMVAVLLGSGGAPYWPPTWEVDVGSLANRAALFRSGGAVAAVTQRAMETMTPLAWFTEALAILGRRRCGDAMGVWAAWLRSEVTGLP